jgi:NitT/TauT family transport system ATP-binding protein
MISLSGVSKVFKTKEGPFQALQDIDLEIHRGEFIALVGPSGCGKSTLLHTVAGLIEPSEGTAEVAGAPPAAGRSDIGIMLQKPVLLPWRDVLRNVLLPVEVLKLDRKEATERARSLLHAVGLDGFENKHVWELSGGMQQRVSLVQSLVADPPILLMDEPFSAVDEFTREKLYQDLMTLHETLGRTTLYVTHNMFEAVLLSDRVVAMKARPGEIVEVIDIDLPRPRHMSIQDDPHSAELVTKVRAALNRQDGGMTNVHGADRVD